jgi:hypothetical protein
MPAELETWRKIFHADYHQQIEVRPDQDCGGMVEVVQREDNGKEVARIAMSKESAVLVAAALVSCAGEIE